MSVLRALGLFTAIGAIPVLSLARTAALNPFSAPLEVETGVIMVLVVAMPLVLVYVAARMAAAHRANTAVGIVGWFAFVFVNFGGVRSAVEQIGATRPWHWILLILILAGVTTWFGLRFDRDGRYLVVFVWFLAGIQSLLLVVDLGRLDAPDPRVPAPSAVVGESAPSIWVVLLDAHASPRALRDSHDTDLAEEVERLEALGFRVWDDARANYSHTLVSVPSLLSGRLWDPDVVESSYPTLLGGLRGDTELVANLRSSGFEIRKVPANWSWSGCGQIVDVCGGSPIWTDHWNYLVRSTPLPDIIPGTFVDPWPARGSASLWAIADFDESPRHFTFVHSLASHPPSVMNSDCRPVSPRDGRLRYQLPCVHDVLAEVLRSIDLTNDVVIIAADHGYNIGNALEPASRWRDDVARDRMSAFLAISTPRGCEMALSEQISLAQVLPLVLNCYGSDLPVPDHRFMKVKAAGFGGVEVDEMVWDGWSVYESGA